MMKRNNILMEPMKDMLLVSRNTWNIQSSKKKTFLKKYFFLLIKDFPRKPPKIKKYPNMKKVYECREIPSLVEIFYFYERYISLDTNTTSMYQSDA